jgi:hypothetical protein
VSVAKSIWPLKITCNHLSAQVDWRAMKQNIDTTGRVARGGISVLLLLVAAVLLPQSRWLAAAFLVAGLFSLFEAVRGWCAIRACGFKLPF